MREIIISISDNYITASTDFAGYQGEHNATILKFKLPDNLQSSEYSYQANITLPDEITATASLTNTSLTLTSSLTACDGTIRLQLVITKGGSLVHKSGIVSLRIKPSLAPTAIIGSNNGISSAEVNDEGNLIITLTDGNQINAGYVKGADGKDGEVGQNGFSPIVTEDESNNDETYKLNIETKDGVITTPNLKGSRIEESFTLDRTLTDPLKAAPADLVGKLYDTLVGVEDPDIPTEPQVYNLVGYKDKLEYHGLSEFAGFLSYVVIKEDISINNMILPIKPYGVYPVDSLTLLLYKNNTLVLEQTYTNLNVTSESDVPFTFDTISLQEGDVLGYGYKCVNPIGFYLSSIAPSIYSKYLLTNETDWTVFSDANSAHRIYAQFCYNDLTGDSDITKADTVWSGKTGNFLGDSITYMGLYTERLSKKSGIVVNNYGISGTTYSNINGTNPFYTRVNGMSEDCDFIFVFGGTNDWGLSAPIGTFSDTETDTFYGGLNATFSALRTKYPTKPIFVSTILQRNLASGLGQATGMMTNSHEKSIFDFNNAIKEVAGRYGCTVVDGCNESGIIYENLDTYTSDRLHLNDVGAERFAQFILDKMNQVTPY